MECYERENLPSLAYLRERQASIPGRAEAGEDIRLTGNDTLGDLSHDQHILPLDESLIARCSVLPPQSLVANHAQPCLGRVWHRRHHDRKE